MSLILCFIAGAVFSIVLVMYMVVKDPGPQYPHQCKDPSCVHHRSDRVCAYGHASTLTGESVAQEKFRDDVNVRLSAIEASIKGKDIP